MKRIALLAALGATFLLGAVLGPSALGVGSADRPADLIPRSYSVGTGSCVEDPVVNPNSGWTFVSASGEYYSVHLNTTIVHPPGQRVDANVSEFENGTYHVALSVVDDEDDEGEQSSTAPTGCRHAATFDLGASLQPPDFVVTFEGEAVQTVHQEETVGNLYPFPAALNATSGRIRLGIPT